MPRYPSRWRLPLPNPGPVLLGLLWALGCAPCGATGTPWVVRHYGSTEGLPVSSAGNSAIDAQGFLWLATHDGLARFDGRAFTVFDAMRLPALGSNRFRLVYADAARNLYALGAGGEWLRLDPGAIERIGQAEDLRVREIQTHPQLCLTTATGLHCQQPEDRQWPRRRAFDAAQDVRMALADGDADWLLVQGEGLLHCQQSACEPVWASSAPLDSAGAQRVHLLPRHGHLLLAVQGQLLTAPAGQPAGWVVRVDQDQPLRDILQLRVDPALGVVAGSTDGLFRIEGTAAHPLPPLPGAGVGTHALSWRAPDGALWRSAGGALYRDGSPVLSSRGTITDLQFGSDGRAFVSTLRDGFYLLSQPRVELLETVVSAPGGGNLYGITEDHLGRVWIGSLGDGLLRIAPDGSVRQYSEADGLPGRNAWAVLAVPQQQRVLVAPYLPGLWTWDANRDRFAAAALPPELEHAQLRALSIDAGGQVWVGGTQGAWQQQADGQWQRRWPLSTAGPTDADTVLVLALAHSPDGTTWFGTDRGLWRQDAPGVPALPVAEALLADTPVRGLLLGSDGTLWACTEGRGLLRLAADDPQGTHARRLGRAEGLPSNSPHAALEDAAGALWINSNQGLFRLTPDALREFLEGRTPLLSPLSLGLADGLTELEGNGGVQPAALADTRGRFWFPSQRGVVRFDPARLPLRRQPPQTVIDALEGDGQPLPLHAPLALGQRSLQIHYNAADLHAGAAVRFRYRLTPLEQRWTEAGDRRFAAYSALPPGQYRFEVLAGNGDGFWARNPATLPLSIPPHWYETGWARALAWLSAVLLIAALIHWRWLRLRQRARQLDALVHERTRQLSAEKQRVESTLDELALTHGELAQTHREIERRNLQLAEQATRLETLDRFRTRLLADVSHELRTPLMLIRLPLEELAAPTSGLTEPTRQQIALPLRQTERLAQLVEQLVGLVRAEAGQLRLSLRRLDAGAWVGALLDGFRPLAERLQVRLACTLAPALPPVYADPTQLATVLGNLLDNALKFAPRGSVVEVAAEVSMETELRIVVRDGGPGFPAAQAEQLFERFFRGDGPPRAGREGLGIGLALARELVALHGGRIGARRPPDGGTEFWFTLPLGHAHVALEELALEAPAAGTAGGPALPAADPAAAAAGGVLLLVEDHPELAAYLAARLSDHYPVAVVADAESAWARISEGQVRAVVSDVVLPGMDGVALCERVRSAPAPAVQQMPVILVSAKSGPDDRQRGLAAGATGWLAKPFALEPLLALLAPAWPARQGSAQADVTVAAAATADTAVPEPGPPPADPPNDPLLQTALAHLADASFGVAEWTARVHLSDRQLRRRVTELTGLAPVVWLREQRLARVRALVGSGQCRTLAQAGYQCGFDNPAYLYRLYRGRYGEG